VATLRETERGRAESVDAARSPAAASDGPDRTQRRRFFWATVAVTLGVSLAYLVRILVYTDGHLVYVIDDPGIHLAIARNLVEHGTWGVTPGVFESASSSPAWTLMLAGVLEVAAPLGSVAPLLGNLAGAIWILWIFATRQRFPLLAKGNWGSWAFVVVLPVCALFLTGLAYTGMEHTLHAAVALQAVVLLALMIDGSASRRQRVAYFALLFAASALRFETMFLAIGCGAALLLATTRRMGGPGTAARWPMRRRIVDIVGTAVAAGVPVLVVGAIDKAFDRRFFPNSIVAKTSLGKDQAIIPTWDHYLTQFNRDALLAALVLLAIVYLVFVWSGFRGRNSGLAMAFVVGALLHIAFASIGWYERYQAYLVIIGIFLLLRVATEVVLPRWREAILVCATLAMILFSLNRLSALTTTPLAASNTYRQQYQIGRFMQRYYEGKPIAVQDLGYISFLHDGPVVDLNGLGSHEVIDLVREHKFDKQAMQDLIEREHVQAIALYADAYAFRLPSNWITVGQWGLGQKKVSPLYSTVTFYAPNERLAKRLDRDLRAFRNQLPPGVTTADRAQIFERAMKRLGSAVPPPEAPSGPGTQDQPDDSTVIPSGP
jgi:hypothetical protein